MNEALIITQESRLMELIKEVLVGVLTDVPYPSRAQQSEEVLTRNEAAKFLNITPTTLTKYVKEGKLKAGGTERKYLFMKSDLVKFMFNR
jgi:excisionase family DNA binding protein